MQKALKQAYEASRRLTVEHGTTYYFSTLFFPAALRQSVYALYGFVRAADEIVDNPPDNSDPELALFRFRSEISAVLAGKPASTDILLAFADTARRHNISCDDALLFLDAMQMDIRTARYETFESLLRYTDGSASAVGLMMCSIMGVTDPQALIHARHLGLAMQLTNFLRDIGEDWETRGRIYVPLQDLESFGCSEKTVSDGKVTEQFRQLMKFEIERARQYYQSADVGIAMLPANCRLPVRLARVLYSRILDKIENNDYDVFTQRARTTGIEKTAELIKQKFAPA